MKLRCSAGHCFDTESAVNFLNSATEGGRCPMVLSYDRIAGGQRTCRRVLREDFPVTQKIQDRMYRNRIDGNGMQSWNWVSTRSLHNSGTKIHEFIAEKLAAGHKVTAGYTTTNIRSYHNHWIFWK